MLNINSESDLPEILKQIEKNKIWVSLYEKYEQDGHITLYFSEQINNELQILTENNQFFNAMCYTLICSKFSNYKQMPLKFRSRLVFAEKALASSLEHQKYIPCETKKLLFEKDSHLYFCVSLLEQITSSSIF